MKSLRNKCISLMLIFTILMAVFMPTIVHAEDYSRVQVILTAGGGSYTISGGAEDGSTNYDSPRSEFFDIGTSLTLTATADSAHNFIGWYNCEEVDISGGHGVMGWNPVGDPLTTNSSYTFTATADYYNIMPVFESRAGHNNIWTTTGGKVAVLYANSDNPNLDGEHFGTGEVVDYLKGDSITVKAKADEGYRFVGWFVTDPEASVPENYVREPVISTNSSFTFQPKVTIVDGVDEPLNYLTAVFESENNITKVQAVDEFVVSKTETEEVSANTDLSEYINSKKWNLDEKNTELNNRWLELFGEYNGVYKYPKQGAITWVFLNQTTENGVQTNHYRVEYIEVTVTKQSEIPIPVTTYEVKFDLNYDNRVLQIINNLPNGSKLNEPDPAPTRDGYTFEGWFEDQTCTTPFDFESTQIENNTIIYAKWAEDNTQKITLQLDGATVSGDVITFNVDETEVTAIVSGTGYSFNGNNLIVNLQDINNVKLALSNNFDTSKMIIELHDGQKLTVNGDNEAIFDGLNFENDNAPHLQIVSHNAGGGQIVGGQESISFDITWNDTYAMVDINGKEVLGDSNVSQDTYSFNNLIVEEAGESDPSKTNVIKITPRFGDNDIPECTINDIVYTPNSDNVEIYDYGWFITVPGAVKYVISATGDSSIATPRTIIWVNPDYVPEDEEDAEWVSDFTISHGSARVIEVYDENDNLVDPNTYIGINADEYGLHDGFGWVAILPGSRVVFEFIPEYGYQLTDISINETPLDAIQDMNRFEVYLPNDSGNLHFAATFTKTEDIVKANSDKVESGEITLGNNLEGGSAQLTVSNVELSSDKIKGFENAAGDYTISNYLDIDLYNVFYKGKDDGEDVWSNKIDELDKEATISLKLTDGITADDIVIVHNVHDGDTYEIIQIESYDPVTNTITFKTKSFSNYAIATKTVVDATEDTTTDNDATDIINNNTEVTKENTNTTSNSPKTGDNITMWIGLMLVSVLGLLGTYKYLRRRV